MAGRDSAPSRREGPARPQDASAAAATLGKMPAPAGPLVSARSARAFAAVTVATLSVVMPVFSGAAAVSEEPAADPKLSELAAMDPLEAARYIIGKFPARRAGGVDNPRIERWVADLFTSTGLSRGEITFDSPVYIPAPARAILPDGSSIRLYSLLPNMVEPCNLPGGRWEGRLVYAGTGMPGDMNGADMTGSAALMEFNCGNRWLHPVTIGARIVIFIEPEEMVRQEAALKTANAPLAVPRYLAPAADAEKLRAACRGGGGTSIRIEQEGRSVWRNAEMRALWVAVPGTTFPNEVVHIQTYLDCESVAPEMAPGAQSALNLALLFRLLDGSLRTRPARTLVFSVVNAHCNALMGEREYCWYAFAPDELLAQEKEYWEAELDREEAIRRIYEDTSDENIERLRTGKDTVAGKSFSSKDPVQKRLTSLLNEHRRRLTTIYLRMKDPRIGEEEKGKLAAEEKTIAAEKEWVVRLLGLFRRFGQKVRVKELTATERARLEALFRELAVKAVGNAGLVRRRLDRIVKNSAIRAALAGKTSVLYVPLDLSFGNDRVGFFYQGSDLPDQKKWADGLSRFAAHSVEISRDLCGRIGIADRLEDTMRKKNGLPLECHLGATIPLASSVAHVFRAPGAAMATTEDLRPYEFTPHDVIGRVPGRNVGAIFEFIEKYLPVLAAHPELADWYNKAADPEWESAVGIEMRRVDPFATTVPEERLENCLALVHVAAGPRATGGWTGHVSSQAVLMTDARGEAVIRGAAVAVSVPTQGFRYDPDFHRVTNVVDFGRGENRFASTIPRVRGWTTRIMTAFDCVKYDLVGLYDPATMMPAAEVDVIDAAQESVPMYYAASNVRPVTSRKKIPSGSDGAACVFMEPDVPFKLRFGGGLLLYSDELKPTGCGILPGRALGPVPFRAVLDSYLLTSDRQRLLREKDVADRASEEALAEARRLLDGAEAAKAAGDNGRFMALAGEAAGIMYRSYKGTLGTTNDMIKAVVAFMLLVIPFCYFLMELVSPWTTVNARIGMFMGIFAVMVAGLALLHPAFQISRTPLVVIVAFVMLGLALFVSGILCVQFHSEMGRAVEEMQQAESAEPPRWRLGGVAFSVGVNNMRRRRIRTSLTCATVVLVTFTMLSVMSVRQHLEPAMARIKEACPYDGFLYMRPGLMEIRAPVELLRANIESGGGRTAGRVWAQRLDQHGGYLPYIVRLAGSEKTLQAKVLLGLEAAEDGFIERMPVVTEPRRWFSADAGAREAMLTRETAAFLGITPDNFRGRKLIIRGVELELIGLLDDDRFAAIRDISGVPLLPFEQTPAMTAQAQAEEKMAEIDVSGPPPGGQALQPRHVVVVNAGFALSLTGEGAWRTIAARYPDSAAAWREANRLIRFHRTRTYVGITSPVERGEGLPPIAPGLYAIATSAGTAVGGAARVIVPLVLAATIILNTMLGAVMERRKEVAIYNAIGLNPTHVFVFFLAEAVVFGMIGSVAGYLIAQALGKAITFFNLLPGLHMNYSSLSVVLVIFIAIGTVLISTAYPAWMATRAAVPSGQARWSLAAPEGDEIRLDFPFSYDGKRVLGACAFLKDYIDQNTEASTGKFLAQDGAYSMARRADGIPIYRIKYRISPIPFDLAVIQDMEIEAYYNERVRRHMIGLRLRRLNGDRSHWIAVNQPFLEGLRKRLLVWRSQSAANQEAFYRRGVELFGVAPEGTA
ncbi:MAG: FtsX-like permease family protein [Planctomycetota bacterium]|nr:FtsX-like permease family protein [Planctomycetota bacterium]